jgi:hypothetical protein
MEPKGSLPHSQVPANCSYPEPARSCPYPHILLPEDILILYPIYACVSQENKEIQGQNANLFRYPEEGTPVS